MKTTVIFLVLSLMYLSGCSSLPAPQRVTTSDASHAYVLSGNGSPVVVLEAGLGDGKESWAPVYGQIARVTRVFAYDRPGYGSSRSAARSRDGATIVRELRSTLRELDLGPPYVLVGHSVGGTYMELFARTYPGEVAGVVLVDARHADFTRQCQVVGARSCTPPALLTALLPNGPKQELAGGNKTMQDVMNAGPFPDVPVTILTSGKKMFGVDVRFQEVWLQTQKELATLSAESEHRVCGHCGHYVHKDDPNLVVAAVNSIVQQVRKDLIVDNHRR